MRNMIARRIAEQNLQQKSVNRRHRIKDPFPPLMPKALANGKDHRRLQMPCDIGLDLLENLRDTASHPWPPVKLRRLNIGNILTGGRFFP